MSDKDYNDLGNRGLLRFVLIKTDLYSSRWRPKEDFRVYSPIAELTMMVNNPITGEPIPGFVAGKSRKVPGPLYPLHKVKAIRFKAAYLVTSKCKKNVASLRWDIEDVVGLINQLDEKDYRDSEWCESTPGHNVACDAYRISKREYVETAKREMAVSYFLKFSVSGSGGLSVLIVSCHT